MKKYLYSLLLSSISMAHASDFKDTLHPINQTVKRTYSDYQSSQDIDQQELEESQESFKRPRVISEPQEQEENRIKENIQLADSYVDRGMFEEALEIYKEVANDPHNTDITIWNKIGLIYINHFEEIKTEFDDTRKKFLAILTEDKYEKKKFSTYNDLKKEKFYGQLIANKFFKKGYELGDIEAQVNYGKYLYELLFRFSGSVCIYLGVEKDKDDDYDYLWIEILEDAADLGSKEALKFLSKVYKDFVSYGNGEYWPFYFVCRFKLNIKDKKFSELINISKPENLNPALNKYLKELERLYNESISSVIEYSSFYYNECYEKDFISELHTIHPNHFNIFYNLSGKWFRPILNFFEEFPINQCLFVKKTKIEDDVLRALEDYPEQGENVLKKHQFLHNTYSIGRKEVKLGNNIENILFGEGSEENPTFNFLDRMLGEDVSAAKAILLCRPDHPQTNQLKSVITEYPKLQENMKKFKEIFKKMIIETQYERFFPEEFTSQHTEHDHESNEERDDDMMDE